MELTEHKSRIFSQKTQWSVLDRNGFCLESCHTIFDHKNQNFSFFETDASLKSAILEINELKEGEILHLQHINLNTDGKNRFFDYELSSIEHMGQPVILWLQMDFTKQYTWKPVEIKKTEVQKIEHDSSQLDASDMPRAGSVLIADDDDLSLLLLRSVLTRYGIRADHVKGGMSALEKYREKKYDLLILDYEMPDKNGLEVTETIRKTDVDTPIVLLTGVDMSENELHGVNSYLSKPIQKEALRSILVQTLGKK